MKTTNLQLPRARWYDISPPIAAATCIFALFLIGLIVGRIRSAPSAAAVPTPALAYVYIATAQPLPPTPAAAVAAVVPENVVRKAIVVYGAPDLTTAIGAVEAGRVFAPVARYGVEWTQVDMDGSGRVFVRTTDLYGVPELVDLQPVPTAQVIERPVYVAAPMPAAATPEPEQYQVAAEQPQTLQQAAILDRQQWAMDAQRAGR